MDNNKHESYEEVHRRLVEAMQKAAREDESMEYIEPDID